MSTFDVTIVLRVEAPSEPEARAQVREVVRCLTYRSDIEKVREVHEPTHATGGINYIL